ncbi:MAG: M48 family metallopeptidase [Defluviitaleaceae bacterium]|nr:M48 family metallopeptidase [Defluviitaleaceae bacterium]
MISYTLIRSRRKTAAIYVRNGDVEVRTPLRTPKGDIDRFITEKEAWILKSLVKQRIQAENKESFKINYGSIVTFRGNQHTITQRSGTRLIMADDSVIDYVVIHELAHLVEMNHSSRFWEIVRCVLPDYKTEQKKLKVLQQRLVYENWE